MRRAVQELDELLAKNNDPRSLRIKLDESKRRSAAHRSAIIEERMRQRMIADAIHLREMQEEPRKEYEGHIDFVLRLIEEYLTSEFDPETEALLEQAILTRIQEVRDLLALPDSPYGRK